ncbi:MAG: adenylate/guanylate cyclase domain-containing protein, partial [Spirochaetaceae bacterium]
MKVRWKIVTVVLPLLAVTIILAGSSAVFSATRGITRIAQEFLSFKASELERHSNSQWGLLVENGFTDRPEMVEATKLGVLSFAESLSRNESELIFAVDSGGRMVASTREVTLREEELSRLRELYESESYGMVDLVLGGIDRVGTGFFFEPFDYYYMVTDERDSFYRDVDRIIRESVLILVLMLLLAIAVLLL